VNTFHDTVLPAGVRRRSRLVTESCPAAATPIGRPPARLHRVGALLTDKPHPAIAAQITARASGHCEIMAPACTYRQSVIFMRRRRIEGAVAAWRSAADGIAACGNCVDLIEHSDLATILDLGYLVNARTPTPTAPMLWRQDRWVYLDTRGHIHTPAAGDAQAAS
jgi:hypothetical protein